MDELLPNQSKNQLVSVNELIKLAKSSDIPLGRTGSDPYNTTPFANKGKKRRPEKN